MKTTYYFMETNGYNGVLVTDGINCRVLESNSDGKYSGIDLYRNNDDGCLDRDNIIKDLKEFFTRDLDGLYSMAEHQEDFPDEIFPLTELEGDEQVVLTKIAIVEK